MLRTNIDDLVTMAVASTVSQPSLRQPGYIPDNEGRSVILPGMSGIFYNVRIGDPAFDWAADHAEPVFRSRPHRREQTSPCTI